MTTVDNLDDLTIAKLFALSPDHPAELAAGLNAKNFKAIAKQAEGFSKPVAWSALQPQIASKMTSALTTKVISGWVSAWKTCDEVKEKAEKSRLSPNAPFSCTLLEHSIDSTLHPYVKVMLDSELIQQIDFDVTLTTQIDGLILNLKGGSLVSIQTGQCKWSGSIAVQQTTLIDRPIAQLDLPGRVVLNHPIPLYKATR